MEGRSSSEGRRELAFLPDVLNNGSSNARPSGHGVTNMHVQPLLASSDDAHDDGGGGSARKRITFRDAIDQAIFKNRSTLVLPQLPPLGLEKIDIEFRSGSDIRYGKSLLGIDSGSRS